MGTDPRPYHKVAQDKSWKNSNKACQLGVSPRFRETSGRWPDLTLTLSFLHRTESEAPPRPASPKVSRTPSEAATPAEDMARRSKLAGGRRWAGKGGQQSRPSHVFRQLGRPEIWEATSPGLLPGALGSDSSPVTLGR